MLKDGLEYLGDFIARRTGFRDWQNGSVVLDNYYKDKAIKEQKEMNNLRCWAMKHPDLAIRAYGEYNDYSAGQLNTDTAIKGVAVMLFGAGLPFTLSSIGNATKRAKELNELIEKYI